MNRLLLLAVLVAAGALGLPARGLALIPCPWTHDVPEQITVVDRGADGQPDTLNGSFVVVARDCAWDPLPGALVTVDFYDCPDIVLDQQQTPPLEVDCRWRTVSRTTDAAGRAEFCIVGAGRNTGASPGAHAHGAIILVSGVSVNYPTVAVLDQNGAITNPGVDITDVVACLRDFGSGVYYGRSDYDRDGTITIVDVVRLLRVVGEGSSILGPSELCP